MRVICAFFILLVTLACASAKGSIFNRLFPKFDENSSDGEIELPAVPQPLKDGAPQETLNTLELNSDRLNDYLSPEDTNEEFEKEHDEDLEFWHEYFKNISSTVNSTNETGSDLQVSPTPDNGDGASPDNERENAEISGQDSGSEMLIFHGSIENLEKENLEEENLKDDNLEDDNLEKENLEEENLEEENLEEENLEEENLEEENLEEENLEEENLEDDNLEDDNLEKENLEEENLEEENLKEDIFPETPTKVADLGPELTGEEEEVIQVESKEIVHEKPTHVDGDAHPSPKIVDLKTDFSDESKVGDDDSWLDSEPSANEDSVDGIVADKLIHVDGDVHPSSLFEETERNADIVDDYNTETESENDSDGDPFETEKAEIRSEMALGDEYGQKNLQEQDDYDAEEPAEPNDELETEDFDSKDELENLEEHGKGDEDIDLNTDLENESPSPEPAPEDGDKVEDQDSPAEDNEFEENDGNGLNQESLVKVTAAPEEIDSCDTGSLFKLLLKPTSIVAEHGKDVLLNCTLIPVNSSIQMPSLTMVWTFQKTNCRSNEIDDVCTTQLAAVSYESQIPQVSYELLSNLKALNQSLHGGKYTCMVVLEGCQSHNGTTSKDVNLRVYVKPNYMLHIGIISGTCVILLAILVVLVVHGKRVQAKSKNRYQELLSTVDIQYQPTKGLELPNSVYNPTTTKFSRMSASSSKSSFSSVEEA